MKNINQTSSGRYSVQIHAYYHSKGKFKPFSLGTYLTEEQAIQARGLVLELQGDNQYSKMKVRISKIREVVNIYRTSENLKPIKERI